MALPPCIGAVVLSFLQRWKQSSTRVVGLLCFWIFLVAFAIAYGRSIPPESIGVLYFDVLLVGIFANGLALLRLLSGPEGRFARWKIAFAVIWLIAVGTAYWQVNPPVRSGAMLRQQKEYAMEQQNVVRGFLSSDNVFLLQEFDRRTHRFPHLILLSNFFGTQKCNRSCRRVCRLTREKRPLSRLAPEVSMTWVIWMGIGACLLLFGALRADASSSGAVADGGVG